MVARGRRQPQSGRRRPRARRSRSTCRRPRACGPFGQQAANRRPSSTGTASNSASASRRRPAAPSRASGSTRASTMPAAHGQPVDLDRHAAGDRVSVGEPISGWQTVNFRQSGAHPSGHDLCRVVSHQWLLFRERQLFHVDLQQRPAQGPCRAAASMPTAPPRYLPEPTDRAMRTTGSTSSSRPDPNLAPAAADDSGFTIGKNGMLAISFASLLANDSDPNSDPLTIIAVGNATNGTVTLDAQTGNVIFTPTAGYSGPASFTYTVSDGRGGTATANVSRDRGAKTLPAYRCSSGPKGRPGPRLQRQLRSGTRDEVHLPRSTARSPASASTRRRTTPDRIPARCGRRPARCWRPSPSPTSRSAAGRPRPSPTLSTSRRGRPTSPPITPTASMRRLRTISTTPRPTAR